MNTLQGVTDHVSVSGQTVEIEAGLAELETAKVLEEDYVESPES